MPALKPDYETFCQYYLVYHNAAEAARVAGYSYENSNQQGYRLLRRPAITRRLAELRAELAERECLAPDALLAKLETAFHAALKNDQPGAAVRIVETQAKLVGLLAKPGAAEPAATRDAHAATRTAMAGMAKHLGLPAPRFE